MRIPREVENIIRLLKDNTHDAYIVGGCVRDTLLARTPDDWDITTDAKPEEIKRIFRKTIDTGIEHGTVTVLMGGKSFEVTTYRVDGDYSDHRRPDFVTYTDDLHEDLKRRDFTINAMAYNHDKGLVDAFCGQEDLKSGIVRCVGDPDERFTEDALRILRAVRFSAQLGFDIEDNTLQAISSHAKDLSAVSAERILVELNKTIYSAHPEKMSLIWKLGMAEYVCKHFSLIKDASGIMDGYKGSWAALMRNNSEEDARLILKELKSDNDTLNRTVILVSEYKKAFPETDADIRHILHRTGPELFDELMDLFESGGTDKGDVDRIRTAKKRIVDSGDAYTLKMLKITGKELIDMGCKPGPKMGDILDELLEMVLCDPGNNDPKILKDKAAGMMSIKA